MKKPQGRFDFSHLHNGDAAMHNILNEAQQVGMTWKAAENPIEESTHA
jgi:hypothetical protein